MHAVQQLLAAAEIGLERRPRKRRLLIELSAFEHVFSVDSFATMVDCDLGYLMLRICYI